MTGAEQLGWVTAVVAVGSAIPFWWPWFGATLNHTLFADTLIKLLRADNPERAIKLTMAVEKSPFATSMRAALVVSKQGSGVRAAFDEKMRAEMARLSRRFGLAMLSLGASALCVYLVVAEGAPPVALIGPALAVGLLGHAYRIARAIAIAGAGEADRVLEVMAERASS